MGLGQDQAIRPFKVTVRKEEVVAPVLPLQEHWLPMSNLDLLLPPFNFSVFFCYEKIPPPPASGLDHDHKDEPITTVGLFNMQVGVLKKAMAQALVPFYALAGEVVQNSIGEPEILCNNRGVDFLEAFADVKLEDLDFHNPDESVEGKLVPKTKRGVMAVQVSLFLNNFTL